MPTRSKICISGIGIISPLGHGADRNWGMLRRDARASASDAVPFRPQDFIKRRYLRPLDEVTLRCIAMSGAAMQDAGVRVEDIDPARVGVVVGSMFAGIGCIFNFKQECHDGKRDDYLGLSPLYFPGIVFNSLSGQPAIEFGYTGPNVVVNAGFTSGLLAVIKGIEYIRSGRADVVIAGGAEMCHPFIQRKFAVQQHTPAAAWIGPEFQPSEAVCLFVLHREDDAIFRARPAYATVEGWKHGFLSAGYSADSLAAAIASVPQLDRDRVGAVVLDSYDNSPAGECERRGIARLLGSSDPILLRNKPNFGHALGASGGLNLFHAIMFACEPQAPAGAVLVNSLDPGGNYALLTLRPGNNHD